MSNEFEPSSFKNAIVFFANGIGDHLIVLPALRCLAETYPNRLSLIGLAGAKADFFADISLQNIWEIPFLNPSHNRSRIGYQRAYSLPFDHKLLASQAGACDLFISLAEWYSADLDHLVKRLAPSVSVGFLGDFSRIITSNPSSNAFDKAFSIARLFDTRARLEDFAAYPALNKRYKALADNLKQNLGPEHRLLVVHTDTKRRKMWSPTECLSTIDEFLSRQPDFLAALVGDYHELSLESAHNMHRIFDVCRIPLGLSFALLSVADLFLGIDSCMLHAADLFSVPSVGIFGPTNPQKWGFRFARHVHVYSPGGIDLVRKTQVLEPLLALCSAKQ